MLHKLHIYIYIDINIDMVSDDNFLIGKLGKRYSHSIVDGG